MPRVIRPHLLEAARALHAGGDALTDRSAARAASVPGLDLFAADLLHELIEGSGIAYISGLAPPDAPLDDQTLRWAYALIGHQLGRLMGPGGGLMQIGAGATAAAERAPVRALPPNERAARSHRGGAGETSFHTDSSGMAGPDILGMLCLHQAASGGECQVSSAFRAHELLRGRHGSLLEELYQPFIHEVVPLTAVPDPAAGVAVPTGRTRRAPIFAACDDEPGVRLHYQREQLETAHRQAGSPLSATQLAAFDRLDQVLADPAACVQFLMRRGEMLFIYNWAVAHNRRPYADHADPRQRRAVVRMWLAVEDPADIDIDVADARTA